jgi:hypothetical protein
MQINVIYRYTIILIRNSQYLIIIFLKYKINVMSIEH